MKLLVLFITLFTSAAGAALERPQEFYDPDVQRLLNVSYFAFGPVGISGATSEGESAFARIVQKRDAIRFILAVYEYGGAHARCYALVALREASPPFFRASLAAMRKDSPQSIRTMSGCIMFEVPSARVLTAIAAGDYAAYFKRYEQAVR